MTESVTIQIITTLGLVVIALIGNRKLDRIGGDAREAREQTANDHSDTELPNLRDDLTAVHATLQRVAEGQRRLEDGQRRHDAEIDGIRAVQRQQTDALARLDERIENHAAEHRRQRAILERRRPRRPTS